MNWKVYVLYSRDHNRFYIGMSRDVEKRLQEHNSGITKSTKGYRPWELLFTEDCESREAARVREKYWKSGVGRERIQRKLRSFLG